MSRPGSRQLRILMVSQGNVCRSPSAEAVLLKLLENERLAGHVHVDSAGTGDWHVGDPPDRRAVVLARQRGYTLRGRAQQVRPRDFDRFDLLVAMDSTARRELLLMIPDDDVESPAKVSLLRDYDQASVSSGQTDVPDPYYGDEDAFKASLDIIEAGCRGLLARLHSEGRV